MVFLQYNIKLWEIDSYNNGFQWGREAYLLLAERGYFSEIADDINLYPNIQFSSLSTCHIAGCAIRHMRAWAFAQPPAWPFA